MTMIMNNKLFLVCVVLLTILLGPQTVDARSGSDSSATLQRYIIELQDPPLAAYAGRKRSTEKSPDSARSWAAAGIAPTMTDNINAMFVETFIISTLPWG